MTEEKVSSAGGLAILILAAGLGTRMRGADKLLQPVAGQPLLRHLAEQALSLGGPVFVILPRRGAEARRAALAGLSVSLVDVPDPQDGMAASLAAGIAALPEICAGAMLLLGDMPEVSAADMDRLVAAFAKDNQNVIRAVDADDQDGHPVIFPARLFPDLTRLRGDRGARDILAAEDIHRVALPGRHATRDLDTPEAWAAWQAEQSKK